MNDNNPPEEAGFSPFGFLLQCFAGLLIMVFGVFIVAFVMALGVFGGDR